MIQIGVIGPGECSPEAALAAEEVGKAIAASGAVLICGGLGGVMAAAAKGSFLAGGVTVGILPGCALEDANPYISIPIATGLSHARNVLVVRSAHVLIAIEGGYGTLSELAIALKIEKPIVGLRTWDVSSKILKAETPQEAVSMALAAVRRPG